MTNGMHDAREALGARLRELRRTAGLTNRRLAHLSGWHESKVSKIEFGRISPSDEDIRAYCRYCDAADQLPDLLATLHDIDVAYLEWRKILSTGTKRRQHAAVRMAEASRMMRIFQPHIVPGILQTAEYAEAVLSKYIDFFRVPDDLDAGVSKRLERQRLLYKGDRRFHILVAEQALSTTVGGDSVMVGQLDRLLAVIGLPRVLLGIIPANAELPMQLTNFVMFDERMVLAEAITAELTITQPREIAIYGRMFAELATLSVTGEGARRLICGALERRQARL
ncbi:helix-turn-helix domain-containing protein [Nocardia bhagyanarayanae]|nr:helix-turn-helix transcriptional regulator [Nocardia bhagyanarayanae]